MALSAKGLVKRYGSEPEYEAVSSVDLEIEPGEFVVIIGRSGSGKSTALAMMGALTKPTKGCVTLDGKDIWSMSETELAAFRCSEIGFIFQFPSLLANLRAVDNVALPAILGKNLEAEAAYARALALLDSVGLGDRSQSYPGQLSGGEQRRVVIARALINSPRFLLADEPTSDLDEDTEADIIELLDMLRRRESVGLIVVAHDLGIARRADRSYEMRHGVLMPVALPQSPMASVPRSRHFGPTVVSEHPPAVANLTAAREASQLGRTFRRGAELFVLSAALVFAVVAGTDSAIAKYQQMRLRAAREHLASLETLALSSLRGDIDSVRDLGDGRYELTLYLWNIAPARPIYVMSSGVRAYVQVSTMWQEVPLQPADEGATSVLKITGKQLYHYTFEARVPNFAQLLPHYMHVRFANPMLISPQSVPKDDLFERKDNYYVYLKPWNVSDSTILKETKFDGVPPVWIPMPPH
jgi:putative ABC transport system ATP-binding protein/macrolide transport system ATP-binding/permease protein/lipoprotein-releasing system ATP-binding protein